MASYAMRGFRSRRTFFRSFVPPHANGVRGGMGWPTQSRFPGHLHLLHREKTLLANQSPRAGSNGGSQPVQPVS
ncbi:hypothetical protein PDIDSM_9177 [Penicillium digitatum]|nr:hypothetical protein PDIDSM_9177 [Penicillium digitatum]